MKKNKFQFRSSHERAVAYASFKHLERLLKEDGAFDPGFSRDVSGEALTIILPPDTNVSRSLGTDGEGHVWHKASQNLNGFAVLTLFIRVLMKFNQWFSIKRPLLDAIKGAIKTKTLSTEDKLVKNEPELAEEIEEIREELKQDLPERKQDTTRDVTYSDWPPTLIWDSKVAA